MNINFWKPCSGYFKCFTGCQTTSSNLLSAFIVPRVVLSTNEWFKKGMRSIPAVLLQEINFILLPFVYVRLSILTLFSLNGCRMHSLIPAEISSISPSLIFLTVIDNAISLVHWITWSRAYLILLNSSLVASFFSSSIFKLRPVSLLLFAPGCLLTRSKFEMFSQKQRNCYFPLSSHCHWFSGPKNLSLFWRYIMAKNYTITGYSKVSGGGGR